MYAYRTQISCYTLIFGLFKKIGKKRSKNDCVCDKSAIFKTNRLKWIKLSGFSAPSIQFFTRGGNLNFKFGDHYSTKFFKLFTFPLKSDEHFYRLLFGTLHNIYLNSIEIETPKLICQSQ